MIFDTHELAWAAGFFDGEGSIGTSHSKRKRLYADGMRHTKAITIDVRQVDRRVLDRFQRAVMIGAVKGPYGPYRNPNQQPFYAYVTSGLENTQAVIGFLWPWLSPIKRTQAIRALTQFHLTLDYPRATTNHNRNAQGRYTNPGSPEVRV